MNAEQLWELVKGWPEEARPDIVYEYLGDFCSPSEMVWHDDNYPRHPMADHHAAALHVASGLVWLYSRKGATDYIAIESVYNPGGNRITVRLCDEDPDAGYWVKWAGEGPTLIAAVSAAIMAVKGGAA